MVEPQAFVIRYDSRSTVNDKPVGLVYALDIDHISPGCWSHVKEPEQATRFSSWDAAFAVIQRHRWHGAEVIGLRGAK